MCYLIINATPDILLSCLAIRLMTATHSWQCLHGCIEVHIRHAAFAPRCSLSSTQLCCSSKILTQDKEHFARLAVDAVLRLKGSSNLESIHIIKKTGGTLKVCASCLC